VKKTNRVTANNDFAKIVKTGMTKKNESFTIHVLANELKKTRIGISVSSRLGSAIKRNKIKRQVRAMCDALIDYNFLSVDIVIVVKQQFMLNDFWQNKELLQFLLTLKRGT